MAHRSAGLETGFGVSYCRHRPEDTLLYQIIERYYPLFEALCIFHAIPVSDSTGFRSLIPRHSGHRFHGIPVSHSTPFRSFLTR